MTREKDPSGSNWSCDKGVPGTGEPDVGDPDHRGHGLLTTGRLGGVFRSKRSSDLRCKSSGDRDVKRD